jgi:hypothetical protein
MMDWTRAIFEEQSEVAVGVHVQGIEIEWTHGTEELNKNLEPSSLRDVWTFDRVVMWLKRVGDSDFAYLLG